MAGSGSMAYDLKQLASYLEQVAEVMRRVEIKLEPSQLGATVTPGATDGYKIVSIDLPEGGDYGPAQAAMLAMGMHVSMLADAEDRPTGLQIRVKVPSAVSAE